MNTKNRNIASLLSFLCFACSLSGCGGAKLLKAPAPLEATDSLARAADGRLSATLEWVIVRDGPGTWARNADWDEYMIRVQNLNGEPVQITSIAVVDALGTVIQPRDSRKQLVAGTKETKRRYKDEGVKVEVGAGAGKLLAGAGIAAATGAAATMAAVGYGTAAGAATVGSIIFVPALAVGGVVRGVNNSKVNQQIESRQTPLPTVLGEKEEPLVAFFPLTPSPRRIELTYGDSEGDHILIINTVAALDGLHLGQDGD